MTVECESEKSYRGNGLPLAVPLAVAVCALAVWVAGTLIDSECGPSPSVRCRSRGLNQVI